METSRRPLENGTANKQNIQKPGTQSGVQRTSRVPGQASGRAPLRRPGDVQQHQKSPGAKSPSAAVEPRKPIRQMTEEQGNGFTLGNLPEVSENAKKQKKKGWIPTKKSRIREPMPLATIVFSILCTVLVMFMMINFVKINEYTRDIADMQSQINKLDRTEQELTVELEKKNDLTNIDFEALGLVKEDDVQKVEIVTDKDETAEYFEVEEQDNGMVATVMNALYRNFREYRNIFFGIE